jgi:hypothetical protein
MCPPAHPNNPPDAIVAFCKLLDGNHDLQQKVKAAINPKQIIDIAASEGCDISLDHLRAWSRELSASYFPWASMGYVWRRKFFENNQL